VAAEAVIRLTLGTARTSASSLAGEPGHHHRGTCRRAVFGWVNRYNTRRLRSYCCQQAPITYEQLHAVTLPLVAVHYPGGKAP